MKYRKLDADGDYEFGAPAEFLKDSPLTVAQAIYTRLLLVAGEWFLDTSEGTPYPTDITGYGTQATRDPAVQERIVNTQGVSELVSYNSQVDAQRRFTVNARVATLFGQVQAAFALPTPGAPTPPPPPPPSSAVWRDTFDGPFDTPLNEHPQTTPRNGSTWSFYSEFYMPRLSGDGSAGDFSGFSSGQLGASTSIFPTVLQPGWSLEYEITPLQSVSSDPGSQASTQIFTEGIFIGYAPEVPSGPQPSELFIGVGDTGLTYPYPAGPSTTVRLVVDADGFTVTLDGVVQDKVFGTSMPNHVDSVSVVLGADTSSETPQAASVQRVEINGTLAV